MLSRGKLIAAALMLALSAFVSCKKADPQACIVTNTTATLPGQAIHFNNCSQDADSYLWDFGDGQSSTEKAPLHQFAEKGEYLVKLTARGNDKESTAVQGIRIGDAYFSMIVVDVADKSLLAAGNIKYLTVEFTSIGHREIVDDPVFPQTITIKNEVSMKPGTHPVMVEIGENKQNIIAGGTIELIADPQQDIIYGETKDGRIKIEAFRKIVN